MRGVINAAAAAVARKSARIYHSRLFSPRHTVLFGYVLYSTLQYTLYTACTLHSTRGLNSSRIESNRIGPATALHCCDVLCSAVQNCVEDETRRDEIIDQISILIIKIPNAKTQLTFRCVRSSPMARARAAAARFIPPPAAAALLCSWPAVVLRSALLSTALLCSPFVRMEVRSNFRSI